METRVRSRLQKAPKARTSSLILLTHGLQTRWLVDPIRGQYMYMALSMNCKQALLGS